MKMGVLLSCDFAALLLIYWLSVFLFEIQGNFSLFSLFSLILPFSLFSLLLQNFSIFFEAKIPQHHKFHIIEPNYHPI